MFNAFGLLAVLFLFMAGSAPALGQEPTEVRYGVGTLRLVGGVGDDGPLKVMCHRCCEADLSQSMAIQDNLP